MRRFTRLSVTELRASTGELLDATAEHGDSFIVERKGKLLACIVPVDVFMPNVAPQTIHAEIDALNAATEQFRLAFARDPRARVHQLEFCFPQRVDVPEREPGFGAVLRVVLRGGFPSEMPLVFLSDGQGQDAESILPVDTPDLRTDGSLDLLPVLERFPRQFSVLFALKAGRRWIERYQAGWADDTGG